MANLELEKFIVENVNKQWNYPELIPDNIWDTDWPWSQINPEGTHDFLQILQEMKEIDPFFVEHRAKDKIQSYGHEGWYSLTLHGIDYDKTENYDQYGFTTQTEAKYHWTSICNRIPLTMQLIKSLPFTDYGRVRIMRLSPRGHIMPHTDGNGRIFGPFNFAINNPEGCIFVMEDYGVVPFTQGIGFLLDLGNKHAILNNSDEYRYHIIIHGRLTKSASSLLRKTKK